MTINRAELHAINDLAGTPQIYLNKHFPSRLTLAELQVLPLDRLKAYNKKHKSKRYQYTNENHTYSIEEKRFNSYWCTNVEDQFKKYFSFIYKLIQEKSQ